MQTPEPFPPAEQEPFVEIDEEIFVRPAPTGFWALGGRLAWVAGLVLTVSAFTDWYAGPNTAGPTLSVIAWHTGTLGKLVFVVGLILLGLAAAREFGFELPPAVPESLVALGSLSTIFVLIRLISIPDSIPPPAGRGIGIWISLLASLAVIVAGLLRASEEL
jgi:hypothetical protein